MHGVRRWVRQPIHLLDIAIVCVSLGLEIAAELLTTDLTEIGGLLVVFRLWRVVRVSHAVKVRPRTASALFWFGPKVKRVVCARPQSQLCLPTTPQHNAASLISWPPGVQDVDKHKRKKAEEGLRARIDQLETLEKAHHTVIQELHKEYTQRVRAHCL